jgi:hypothetical protein
MNFVSRSFAGYSSHAYCVCRNCTATDSSSRRFNKQYVKRAVRRSAKVQIIANIEENIINLALSSYSDNIVRRNKQTAI